MPALQLRILGILYLQPGALAAVRNVEPILPFRDDAFHVVLAHLGEQPRALGFDMIQVEQRAGLLRDKPSELGLAFEQRLCPVILPVQLQQIERVEIGPLCLPEQQVGEDRPPIGTQGTDFPVQDRVLRLDSLCDGGAKAIEYRRAINVPLPADKLTSASENICQATYRQSGSSNGARRTDNGIAFMRGSSVVACMIQRVA